MALVMSALGNPSGENGRSVDPRASYMLVESRSAMDLRRFRITRFAFLAVLLSWGLVCLQPSILRAQNPTAQLSGTISDQSGAPVPDARVQITGVATGLEQTTTTNTAGQFVFPVLQPGEYKVKIRKEGFTQLTRSGIALGVSQ